MGMYMVQLIARSYVTRSLQDPSRSVVRNIQMGGLSSYRGDKEKNTRKLVIIVPKTTPIIHN
jgi:hypothetical protein